MLPIKNTTVVASQTIRIPKDIGIMFNGLTGTPLPGIGTPGSFPNFGLYDGMPGWYLPQIKISKTKIYIFSIQYYP